MCDWTVSDSRGMSATEQAGFVQICNNAIGAKGWDNKDGVVTYVRDACQKEWPKSGRNWVVLYTFDGSFSITCGGCDKKMFVKDCAGRTEYIWAARV